MRRAWELRCKDLYKCERCGFSTFNKAKYRRHTKTIKHALLTTFRELPCDVRDTSWSFVYGDRMYRTVRHLMAHQ